MLFLMTLRQKLRPTTYHARVDRSLLDVSSDTSHKGVAVLEVGVEVGLWGDAKA